ncbi:MAG: helix-turn-helix transcriptional regulator [Tissierellia bacterium]|nr:helix-turn-helix transcriptional regulator [Tissierellia bacterium]
MNTGKRIRRIRIQRGLYQADLASSVGMSESVLSRIENGSRPVRDRELLEIAKKLEVSADYLLGVSLNPLLSFTVESDIARNVEEMRQDLESGTLYMSLDGEEINDDTKKFILDQIENILSLAKIKEKENTTSDVQG